jgi:hypothetical protein
MAMENMPHGTPPAPGVGNSDPPPDERLKSAQFDYAWKWFVFHADQRTKMFNFMLVAMGLFANAIVTSIDKDLRLVAAILCAVTGIVAIIFRQIDWRNEHLVNIGEDALKQLETKWLFMGAAGEVEKTKCEKGHLNAILLRKQEDDAKLVSENWVADFYNGLKHGKHRTCLRAIALLMAALFIVGAIWIGLVGITPKSKPAAAVLVACAGTSVPPPPKHCMDKPQPTGCHANRHAPL